jgi:hypothetical protein
MNYRLECAHALRSVHKLSYSSKDRRAADATVVGLEEEGLRCWIAPRDIPPGAPWASSIFQAIDQCRVLVLILSSRANSSSQVVREVARAAEEKRPIIPIRIEATAPVGELGYYLSGLHWADTTDPPQQEALKQLARNIRSVLATRLKDQLQNRAKAQEQYEKTNEHGLVDIHGVTAGNCPTPYQTKEKKKYTLGCLLLSSWYWWAVLSLNGL